MRGAVPGLTTPFLLVETLPGLLQDDAVAQQLCAALDEVLAPIVVTLDCLPAYLDPATAPPDVLDWLAGWVGVALPEGTDPQLRRRLVERGADLHRGRGTMRGVREAVAVWFGVEPELRESGGAAWSAAPGAALPGGPAATLHVLLRVPDPSIVDVRRLEAVVGAAVPVHVTYRVEVVADG